jgi:hypothetical protein
MYASVATSLRPHGLYVNLAMRRDYLSPGCTGSTSPTPCTATTHLPVVPALYQQCRAPRLLISRSHWLDYVVRRKYTSPGCSNSTSAMSYVASTCLPVAQALLRLCRASGHAISPLDFSSVGHTGSRRASGHCVSRRDYSSSGLHRLYRAYVTHPDAPSRHLTSRRSVTLALVVRPVTASRGATTRRLDCTSSTAPMLCIQTHRLDTRLLVSRSHWLSPCSRSFCCVS